MKNRLFPQSTSYTETQKLLHWSVLLLCIVQFPTSWAIQRTHDFHRQGLEPEAFDLLLHKVHAFSGWTILALVGLRLFLRLLLGGPALPSIIPLWQRRAAAVNHALLYVVLLALPVTGTAAMYVTQLAVPFHQALVYLGIALVAIHVGAAIIHAFARDGTVARMIPSRGARTLRSQPRKSTF